MKDSAHEQRRMFSLTRIFTMKRLKCSGSSEALNVHSRFTLRFASSVWIAYCLAGCLNGSVCWLLKRWCVKASGSASYWFVLAKGSRLSDVVSARNRRRRYR